MDNCHNLYHTSTAISQKGFMLIFTDFSSTPLCVCATQIGPWCNLGL